MDKKILIEALGRPWFIEPQAAAYYASIIHKLFTGESITEFEDKKVEVKDFAFVVDAAGKRIGSIEDAANNGVAVINMKGALMKYDYCGAPGTQTIIKALQQANDNPAINSIVLQIDSPGGSVDGTQQLSNAVKSSGKPVVAYINGMMASAAMWVGSAAAERIASSSTDVIGSIGTMSSWKDMKGYFEQKGIKSHEVYATDSTHKNHQFREAEQGNYEPMIKTWLDPLNNEFQAAIKENLPGVDPVVLNGSHYIAKDAKKKGLINRIGTFEQAVKTALQMGNAKSQNSISKNMNAFQKTLAAAQATAFAVVEGGFLLQENDLNNIDAVLSANATAATEASQQIAAAVDAKTTAEASLATANETIAANATRITDLEAKVAELNKKPASEFSSTAKDKDEAPVANDKKNAHAAFDAFADEAMGIAS